MSRASSIKRRPKKPFAPNVNNEIKENGNNDIVEEAILEEGNDMGSSDALVLYIVVLVSFSYKFINCFIGRSPVG